MTKWLTFSAASKGHTTRQKNNAQRESLMAFFPLEGDYAFKKRGNFAGLLSNPGNTECRLPVPRCPLITSPSTERKSVVSARSRPSFNCPGASPGHLPYTFPPFTGPPIANMQL